MYIIIFIAAFFIPMTCYADQQMMIEMPIRVRILNCSTYEVARDVCETEGKCCQAAEDKLAEANIQDIAPVISTYDTTGSEQTSTLPATAQKKH